MRRSLPALLLLLLLAPAALGAQGTPPPACASPDHRAFDYWVGEWSVTDTGGTVIARSSIARVSDGCAIAEHWQPLIGKEGRSLSWYEPKDGKWHQQWVGGGGWIARFDGTVDGDEMVLTEAAHPSASGAPISRMRYSKLAGGIVRQTLWQSTDQGASWKIVFVGDYNPRAGEGN